MVRFPFWSLSDFAYDFFGVTQFLSDFSFVNFGGTQFSSHVNSLDRFRVLTLFRFLGFGDDDTGKEKASADEGVVCEVASGPPGYGVTQTARSAANEMWSLAGERHCSGLCNP